MKFRYVLPLIFFLMVALLLWRALSLHPNQIPSPLINKPVPTFELPTLMEPESHINQNDFKGQVTLLNVWATWCYSCALEHNNLLAISEQEGFVLYGLDYKDDRETAINWLKEHGNPFKTIAFDTEGKVGIDWGVYGTPETFIIDKKGIIRHKLIGPITDSVWEKELKPLIEKLRREA